MESNYIQVVRIQRWYRSNHLYKKKDTWWPVDSYNGTSYSYNKWTHTGTCAASQDSHVCFSSCIIL